MTTKLAKVKEENGLLADEVTRLRAELAKPQKVNILVRMWRRLFGRRVYDGPETCGHCKYWRRPWFKDVKTRCRDVSCCNRHYHYSYGSGDCKLLFSKKDTMPDVTCPRFTPRWRYYRRVR